MNSPNTYNTFQSLSNDLIRKLKRKLRTIEKLLRSMVDVHSICPQAVIISVEENKPGHALVSLPPEIQLCDEYISIKLQL